jgi:hypothetical protein
MAAHSTVYLWVKVGDHGTAAEVTVTGPRLHVHALKEACLTKFAALDEVKVDQLDVYLDTASHAAGTPLEVDLSLTDVALAGNTARNPLILVVRGT